MSAITDKKKYLAVDSTYEKKAKSNINGFDLIYDGKTIDAFLNKQTKEIIVGVRGTADVRDVKTDITLIANRLASSSRYADDVSQFKSIVIAYPPSEYTYHLASHSLGGAIAKQLLRDFPFIKSSLGFNPAKQTKDLNDYDERNTDYYINKDALYNTFGKMSKDKKKVFEYKPKKTSGFFSWIKQKATPTFINAHLLDNFKPIVGAGIRNNPLLLELFKGSGSVGKVAKRMGFDVISLDLDPAYTPEIETDILKWDYKKFQKDNNYIPDFIWASPPCNTYSPLAYPLKERNTKSAIPYSNRAKEGTAILYKTLEIIDYFLKLNPKLLYCIENPRGMMRNDKKMLKIPFRATARYCLYSDKKNKPTDFWSNYPIKLKYKGECKNTVSVVDLPLLQRYSIPSSLIKSIITQGLEYIKTNKPKNTISNNQTIIEGSGKSILTKYVPEGLSKRDKKKQIESIKKQTIRPKVDYPQRKSKWTKKAEDYFKGDTSIENISKVTGVPVKGLKLVIKKGEKAYYSSGSRPNIHPVQWGTARLYSLLFGNEVVRRMDKDIIEKYNIPNLVKRN